MTQREFFAGIVEGATITEEQATFAVEAIAKLDKRNQSRKDKPSKTAIANEPIKARIVEVLTPAEDAPTIVATAATIATMAEITTQKASALCRQLVEEGVLVAGDVKVKGKGKCKGYTLAPSEDAEA